MNFNLNLLTIIILLILIIYFTQIYLKNQFINNLKYGTVFRDKQITFNKQKYKYIDFDDNFLKKNCPSPPKNTSHKTYNELKFLKNKMKNINSKKIKLFDDLDNSADLHFIKFIEDNNLNIDWDEYTILLDEIEQITYKLKYMFNRPRPYQLGLYFNLPIMSQYANSGNTPAYPSGHAMLGHMCYLYLGTKYPMHKKKLYELAKEVENSRVDVGVHYVSDGNASEKFLQNIFPLIKNKLYKKKNLERSPSDIVF